MSCNNMNRTNSSNNPFDEENTPSSSNPFDDEDDTVPLSSKKQAPLGINDNIELNRNNSYRNASPIVSARPKQLRSSDSIYRPQENERFDYTNNNDKSTTNLNTVGLENEYYNNNEAPFKADGTDENIYHQNSLSQIWLLIALITHSKFIYTLYISLLTAILY